MKPEEVNQRIREPMFTIKKIICVECGFQFLFSAKEQRFYWNKGFVEPKRCIPCRKAKTSLMIQYFSNEGGVTV